MFRRAQATAEHLALIGCVAALLLAVVALPTGTGTRLGSVITALWGNGGVPTLDPAALAFAERAISGAGTPQDAIAVLGGDARALEAVHAIVRRRYATAPFAPHHAPLADPSLGRAVPALDGTGPPLDGAWSVEEVRGLPSVRIITADDEARWMASRAPDRVERIIEAAAGGAVAVASAVNPGINAATIGVGAAVAAAATPERGVPAGSRSGDLVVCRIVWRTNLATPAWREARPAHATRLALGQRQAVVVLAVVRAGRVIQTAAVVSDATAC